MKDHILVVGTPSAEANRFFKAIARQFRGIPEWADVPIHLVTRAFDSFPDGLPDGLRALDVVHSSGAPTDPDALIAADAGKARAVIVLADREDDPLWDAVTIDVASRIVEMARLEGSPAPTLVVECVEDRNRHRMLAAGATSAVRPLRTYPEMLVRAVVAPGSEHLLESLFRSEGDDLHRIDLGTVWRGRWSDLACPLLQRNVGTAIACMAPGGAITINPAGDRPIDVAAIFIVVRDMRRTLCTEVSAIVGVPVRLSE